MTGPYKRPGTVAQDRGRGVAATKDKEEDDNSTEVKLPLWLRQVVYLAGGFVVVSTAAYQFVIQDIKANSQANALQQGELKSNRQYSESISREVDALKIELKSFESLHAQDDKEGRREEQAALAEIRRRVEILERDLAVLQSGHNGGKK